MNDLRRIRAAFASRRPKGQRWFGLLGDHDGTVAVSGRPGWRYVRVERGVSYEVGKYRAKIPLADVANTPVILEEDPLTGERWIVALDQVAIEASDYDGTDLSIALHSATHGFGGRDQLQWLHMLQIYWPSRVQVKAAQTVRVQAGVVPLDNEGYMYTYAEDLDLSSYFPGSGSKYVLIYGDKWGQIQVDDSNSATLLRELAHPPSGIAIAAVQLTYGQALTQNDIADLRLVSLPGVREFLGLSDTESSYDDHGGEFVKVSAGENGLTFGPALSKSLEQEGTFTIQLTSTLSGITQYNSQTVTLSPAQADTDYHVFATAEGAACWFGVDEDSKATDSFELYVYGQAPSGVLEADVHYWVTR
jgi:hypothetical protein